MLKYQKACATNAADTSFPSRIPTATRPDANDGVHSLQNDAYTKHWIRVVPYGVGDDDAVFEMWITGWSQIDGLWIPTRLVKLTCTLSTAVGVAGEAVVATERFADTITATKGVSNVTYKLQSTEDNTPAHALVFVEGYEFLEFTFDMTTGDPTGANCLWVRTQE